MKRHKLIVLLLFLEATILLNPVYSQQWAFLTGDSILGDGRGVFGIRGIESTYNKPGERELHNLVVSGNSVWLFGGNGYAKNYTRGNLSDLWKFNPLKNNWTWINGPDTVNNINGVYGTLGVSESFTNPAFGSN